MENSSQFLIRSVAEDASLIEVIKNLEARCWPKYMFYQPERGEGGEMSAWDRMFELFPAFQFAIFSSDGTDLLAAGNSVPLFFEGPLENLPDTGWDWALDCALSGAKNRIPPNYISALSICVDPSLRGQGISKFAVHHMRNLGKAQGMKSLLAPVRPVKKAQFPLVDIEEFSKWRTDTDQVFDPWLRVHLGFDSKLRHPCRRSMTFSAPINLWETWFGMRFPVSGTFVVDDLLAPLQIDVEASLGIYIEPNIWVEHRLT